MTDQLSNYTIYQDMHLIWCGVVLSRLISNYQPKLVTGVWFVGQTGCRLSLSVNERLIRDRPACRLCDLYGYVARPNYHVFSTLTFYCRSSVIASCMVNVALLLFPLWGDLVSVSHGQTNLNGWDMPLTRTGPMSTAAVWSFCFSPWFQEFLKISLRL